MRGLAHTARERLPKPCTGFSYSMSRSLCAPLGLEEAGLEVGSQEERLPSQNEAFL